MAQLAAGFIEDAQKRSQYLFQINSEQKVRELPLCYVAPDFDKEIDRLAEIISQRQSMNEQIGIIVPTNRQVFGFSTGLEERGVFVEKAAAGYGGASYDFNNSLPKIATYFSAKGLTFDSVLLPRLTESAFSWIADDSLRSRLFFVGIARATQWAYLSTVAGKEFTEIKILRKAESAGHLIFQRISDIGLSNSKSGPAENFDDDFSIL